MCSSDLERICGDRPGDSQAVRYRAVVLLHDTEGRAGPYMGTAPGFLRRLSDRLLVDSDGRGRHAEERTGDTPAEEDHVAGGGDTSLEGGRIGLSGTGVPCLHNACMKTEGPCNILNAKVLQAVVLA